MKRFILTGAPGSGKTAVIRQLELEGFGVIEEAATAVIALEQARGNTEPWKQASFIDAVVTLQKQRLERASSQIGQIQFHDRSAFCTAALAVYLKFPISDVLAHELERLREETVFQRRVFFIQNLGFITPTEARRISFEETLRFERIHEETYRSFGFEIFPVKPGSIAQRMEAIKGALE
jgi:predicted ATPase